MMNEKTAESIEANLHAFKANLRREFEQAKRQKDLASERLRILREEHQALVLSVQDAREKLEALRDDAELKEGIQLLEQDVERLTKEVKFQHTDYTDKQSQRKTLVESQGTTAKKLDEAKKNIQNEIQRVQTAISSRPKVIYLDASRDSLQAELDDDQEGRLVHLWPRIVERKVQAIKEEIKMKQQNIANTETIIRGYQQYSGVMAAVKN